MIFKNNSLIIDIDGTLCKLKDASENYYDLIPNEVFVKKLIHYKSKGWYLIFYTSRNMKTFSGDLSLINKNTLPQIINWFNKWKIPFDQVLCGKPWPGENGFYIDDRAIRPQEFLNLEIDEINKLLEQDRIKE